MTAEITAAEAELEQAKDREEELIRMRGEIQQIANSARGFIDSLKPRLDATKHQITALGAAPAKDAPPEHDGVAHERFKLNGLAGAIDGAMRTSELIAERCSQLIDRIQQHQRDLFTRSLLKRTPSPILPTLWLQLIQESKRGLEDINRLARNWWSIAEGHRLELMGLVGGLVALWAAARGLGARAHSPLSQCQCRRADVFCAGSDGGLGGAGAGAAVDRLHGVAVSRRWIISICSIWGCAG